jgi:hypothetical protein
MSVSDRRKEEWHLSKSVSVSQIAVLVTMCVAGFKYTADMDKRIALIEQRTMVKPQEIAALDKRVTILEKTVTAKLDNIETTLIDIKDKL